MSGENLQYSISGDDNPIKQTLDRVKSHFTDLHSHVTNVTSGIQGALGKVNAVMATVAAALAGGAAIKGSVEATKEFTGEATKLAKILGTNATEASTLNVALGDVYSDADAFAGAASKLAKELRTNEQSLRDLGLQTRNADGSLRPLKDLMMDSIKVVNSYKEGIDRNIAAQVAWGKSAGEYSSLLKLNNDVLDAAREKQEQLGLVVGVENVEAAKAYKAAMNDVGDVMLAVKKAIGDAFMPVLTKLGEWFASVGPAAVTVIKGAVGGLVAVFWGLKNAVQIAWEVIAGVIESLTAGLAGVAQGFWRIITGDWKGGVAAFQGAADSIKASWSKRMDNMVQSSQEARDKIYNLFSSPTAATTQASSGKSAAGLLKKADPKKDESDLSKWEAELNRQKEAHAKMNAENGTFYEFSKQRELEFWQSKLALATKNNDDAFKVQSKITKSTLDIQKDAFDQHLAQLRREEAETEQNFARKGELAQQELALIKQRYGTESKEAEDAQRHIIEIEKQARDQRNELRRIEIDDVAAANLQQVDLTRQRLQLQNDAGLIDKATMLRAEQDFEDQRYRIQQQALLQRQQLNDPDKNPVEAARIKEQMLELERQYQLKLGEIRGQAALENNKYLLQGMQSLEQGLTRVFSQIGTQIKTVGQLVRAVFQTVAQTVVSMFAQMAAKWIAQNILMQVAGKTSALSAIMGQAGVAGAAGTASWAAAPWPINMGAPAFGAAMSAEAMAYAPMASAEGGFDIPSGLNPVTQLHEREMVLPKEQADVIRGMAGGGGSGGGMSVVIHAVDGASIKRVLMDNPTALAEALKSAQRRGHI